jgi:hypothetical protein
MKKVFISFLFFFSFFPASQRQNLSTTIKVQAMDMGSALMKNDFKLL